MCQLKCDEYNQSMGEGVNNVNFGFEASAYDNDDRTVISGTVVKVSFQK